MAKYHQVGWIDVGHGTGNTGSLNVSGAGKFFHEDAGANNDSNIGRGGATGELNITAGGFVQTNFWLNVARDSGSTGSVLVDGAGSLLRLTGNGTEFNIGEQGTGSLDVTMDGKIETAVEANLDFNVGRDNGSIGTLLVETGGHLAMATDVANGDVGARNGARLIVGNNAGSQGTVTIQPTALVEVRHLTVGQNGKATVMQEGGTVNVAQWMVIGEGDTADDAGNPALYTLNDGVINTPELMVGQGRKGDMVVNGGTVNILNASFAIGRWGAGWNGNGAVHGNGTLTQNGGVITVPVEANLDIPVGVTTNAIGTLNLNAGAHFDMSSDEANGDVGQRNGGRVILGNDIGSQGTLNIGADAPGPIVALVDVRHLTVGQNGKGTGTQEGGTLNVAQWMKIGEGDSGGPTGDDELEPDLVTPAPGENKALYTLNAGVINTPELMIGEGRRGEMVVNGGTVNILNGGFGIGRWGPGWNGGANWHGEGKLTQNGGVITAPVEANLDIAVGNTTGAIGTLNINAGAHFDMSSDEANGDVGQRNGGRVILGNDIGSQGTLNIGADAPGPIVALVDVRHLTVGQNGKGTVVQDGGVVNVAQWLKIGEGDSGGPTGDDELEPDLVTPAPGENKALYTLNAGVINTPELMIGEGRRGAMVVNGGEVNILNGGFGIGRWGPGWNGGANWHGEGNLTQTGGMINSNGQLLMADTAGSKGFYNLSGGTLNLGVGGNHNLIVGNAGNGTMNFTGGTVLGVQELNIGNSAGSVSDMTVDGVGTILNAAGESHIGNSGKGTLTVRNGAEVHFNGGWAAKVGTNSGSDGKVNVETGGKLIATNSWLVVGAETGSVGRMDISDTTNAGTLVDVSNPEGRFITGRLGTAVVNQSGGDVKTGNWFALGLDAGSDGTYNFSGGTIDVSAAHNVDIAQNGKGRMTITHGNAAGTTIVGGAGVVNYFNVGAETNSNGRLDIALANATDKIVSRELYAGNNAGSIGLIEVTSGILQTNEAVQIGRNNITALGTINVDGPIAVWNRGTGPGGIASDVQIGFNGGTGNLNVKNGGTVNHNWWLNVARGATSTGHVTVDGTGSLLNIVDGYINVGEDGVGTMEVTNGGKVLAPNGGTHEFVIGRNGGSNGSLVVKTGGVVETPFLRAGGGIALLKLEDGGILKAGRDEANFIQGFDDGALHSAIRLEGTGGTIDSNGHRVRITAGNVIAGLDANPSDGLAGTVLTIAGDATLFNDTDKVTLEIPVGTGNLSVHVLSGGFLDSEVSQTLDNLTIDSGGYFELSALASPPGAPAVAANGGFDGSAGDSMAGSPVQGVPEPGTISLLLLSGLGLLGRRKREKKA